ncbi:MAG: hypothetical protein HQK89_17700 [Nitrospirae bacterium]|nr:hypothetical protein [Nitrospirota bacterium]
MPTLPGVNHQRAVNALKKVGFWIIRQGKHITMTNGSNLVTIPRSNPIDAVTMGVIIRGAGLTIDEFKELL